MADIVKELKASAYTVASLAKIFQDYFRGDSKDIEVKYMNPDGEVKSITIPNVRKLTDEIKAVSINEDQLKDALKKYYTKDEIDDTVSDLKTKINDETKKVNDDLNSKIDSTKSDLNNKIEGVDSKLENTKSDLKSKIDNVDKKVNDVSSDLKNKTGDLDKALKDTKATLIEKVEDVDILSAVMTKEEFEAIAETRREYYAGSGVVEVSEYNDNASWTYNINDNGLKVWKRNNSQKLVKTLVIPDYRYSSKKAIFNVNGYKIRIVDSNLIAGAGLNYIEFPEEQLPVVEKDSTKLSKDYKQGDWIYLTDTERELVTNGTFNGNIDTWSAVQADISYNDDDDCLDIHTTDEYPVIKNEGMTTNMRVIGGVTYEIRIKASTSDSSLNKIGVLEYINTSGGNLGFDWNGNEGVLYYTPKNSGNTHWAIFIPHAVDKHFKIYSFSIKPAEPAKLVVTNDISAGSDAFKNAEKFLKIDSFSRQDLVFLETWHEDITEKDVVYPYGNVQYSGGDVDGLNGIGYTSWFDGYKTYSLFGSWQNPGDLVGKGYRWSKLSKEDKIKLLNNPENNLYRDGDKIIQVRYRIRVVKGLGNEWKYGSIYERTRVSNLATSDYNTAGIVIYNTSYERNPVLAQGKHIEPLSTGKLAIHGSAYDRGADRSINDNGLWLGVNDGPNELLTFNSCTLNIPIALVQRRNPGIYHPVYNPEGCALVYDSSAKEWFEAKDDDGNLLIKSVEDCFNHDYIAVVNKDDHSDAAKLSEVEDGSISADKYKKTGYIESMMSGRPDGLLVDEVNERDVEDLRMDAHPIEDYNQFLESEHRKLIAGNVRGKEKNHNVEVFKNLDRKYFRNVGGNRVLIDYYHSTWVGFDYGFKLNPKYISEIYVITPNHVLAFKRPQKYGSYYVNKFEEIYFDSERIVNYNNDTLNSLLDDFEITFTWNDRDKGLAPKENINWYLVVKYEKSPVQNNTYLQCDIIGDPRKLKDRVEIDVNDDKTVNIREGMYLKCSDNSKNNGKKGHYYLALKDINDIHTNSDDGDANTNNGHIDFSNDDVWTDLGDNGNLGGYPDEWLEHGIYGSPLLVGENGEDLTPIRGYFNYNTDSRDSRAGYSINARAVFFKLSKKGRRIKEVIAIGKDGRYVKYNEGNWRKDLAAEGGSDNYNIGGTNHIYINIGNDDTLDALGFDNVKEAVAEVVFLVYYETYANFLEITNNIPTSYASSDVTITNYDSYYYGGSIVYNCLNKVSVGDIAGNTAGKINGKTLHNDWQTNNYHLLWHIPFEVDSHYTNSKNDYSPAVKFFSYLIENNNRAQINFIFKELKRDLHSNNWGDDNKFQITDKVRVITDTNGKYVLYGQKAFKTNRFIKKS